MNDIILICTPLQFYTACDENLFFSWLAQVPAIYKYEGKGKALHCYITSTIISDQELLDLLGIFDRYKFEKQQLTIFKNENNREWFE